MFFHNENEMRTYFANLSPREILEVDPPLPEKIVIELTRSKGASGRFHNIYVLYYDGLEVTTFTSKRDAIKSGRTMK